MKKCRHCGNISVEKSMKKCPACGKTQTIFPVWLRVVAGVIALVWFINDGRYGWENASKKEPKEIVMVKQASINMCPDKTLEQMVKGYFGNPKWISGRVDKDNPAAAGRQFVDVTGGITYQGKPVDATLQFLFNEKGDDFEIYVLGLNGVAQNQSLMKELLEKMCDE